jgi:hypothetical protein
MPTITNIVFKQDRQRYWIFVDGAYCASVRERTFPALNIKIGQHITCEQIKELETHHWKHAYGESAWAKEKVRLQKVKELIESLDGRVIVEIVGFGADSHEFISGHPSESGKPDLEVRVKNSLAVVLLVEVTGTEVMRGQTYWVRPDKLSYAKNHPEHDVWLILHYMQPVEKYVFIKPDLGKTYVVSEKLIRESKELYIEFVDSNDEVVSRDDFKGYLENKVSRC